MTYIRRSLHVLSFPKLSHAINFLWLSMQRIDMLHVPFGESPDHQLTRQASIMILAIPGIAAHESEMFESGE